MQMNALSFVKSVIRNFFIVRKLRYHVDRVHEKKLEEICFICNKEFYNKSALRKHLTTHDASRMPKQPYLPESLVPEIKKYGRVYLNTVIIEETNVCTVCLKTFTAGPSKRRHEELHKEPKKHTSFMENSTFEKSQSVNAYIQNLSFTLPVNYLKETNTNDKKPLNIPSSVTFAKEVSTLKKPFKITYKSYT